MADAASIPSPITNRIVTVSATTLFHVAAKYLGDATKWYQIAALNGLYDPVIFGMVTLKIPSKNNPSNGGILGL